MPPELGKAASFGPVDEDGGLAHVVLPVEPDADNAPEFVRDLAVGDIVRARAAADGQHPTFDVLIRPSDHLVPHPRTL